MILFLQTFLFLERIDIVSWYDVGNEELAKEKIGRNFEGRKNCRVFKTEDATKMDDRETLTVKQEDEIRVEDFDNGEIILKKWKTTDIQGTALDIGPGNS